MSTVFDTDIFLAQRGTTLYQVAAVDLKKTPASTLWTPKDDSRTSFWYDFSDAASITLTTGRVSQVRDQITGAQALSNAAVQGQPVQQGGGIGWDGTGNPNGGLTRVLPAGGNNTAVATWFLVSTTMGLDGGQLQDGVRVWTHISGGNATNNSEMQFRSSVIQSGGQAGIAQGINAINRRQPRFLFSNGVSVSLPPTGTTHPWPYAGARPFELVFAGTDDFVVQAYQEQVLAVTHQSFSGGAGSLAWRGAMLDLVGLRDIMTIDDNALRQRLEGWAAWKHGQQAVLPSDHPYKAAAPTV